MAFNWEDFATGFLSEISEGIDERTEAAKEYKEKQEAAAERNAALINQRNMRAQEAAQLGKRAIALGASKAQVKAAMASGMTGVTELYQKLQAAANQKGVKKLGVDDIEAIVNMPSIPLVNTSMIDMSLEDFAKRTYGAMPTPKTTKQPSDNIIAKMFGYGAKDRVKQELANTEYMSGMSVADINEMARQSEYTSLIPGATMTFLDVEQYTPKAVMDFNTKLTKAISDATKGDAAEAYIKARRRALGTQATLEQIQAEEMIARKTLEAKAAKIVIETYAGMYANGGFFTNDLTLRQIKDAMGETYLNDLMVTYGFDEEEVQTESTEEETTQEEETNTEAEETEVSAKEEPLPNVYYRNDEGGIVNGVPPRPEKDFSTIFFGQGMGGEDMEKILKGEMPVPKYLRQSQWDELFGKTHNPDGTPK